MLHGRAETIRVLHLCETALQIIDHSNPLRLESGGNEAGTFIAHCYDVKLVLFVPLDYERRKLIDIWHNRIVLSVEWDAYDAQISKFLPGKWEDRLDAAAKAFQPRHAVGWS